MKSAIMGQSTRTAEEAAKACGCEVGQIVKSLIFERSDNHELVLVLVSGKNQADIRKLGLHFNTILRRAEPRKIRDLTGFAIGGVAPIGHLTKMEAVADNDLSDHHYVWAAAGRPDTVFRCESKKLLETIQAAPIELR